MEFEVDGLFVESREEWLDEAEEARLEFVEEKSQDVEAEEEAGERKLQCHPKKLLTKKWIHSWSSDKKKRPFIQVAQDYIIYLYPR